MSQKICANALLKCSMGAAPCPLVITPEKQTLTSSLPAASIMDNKPTNVPTFGVCNASFPPTPCSPITPSPWLTGSPTVLTKNQPSLTKDSKLICARGGVIEIIAPTQFSTEEN